MNLSECLHSLTYHRSCIVTPKQLNVFMGIGIWSVKNGLSEGLPVDVMPMLLSATLVRLQILEAHHGKPSKVILLIADSLAIQEGGDREKVAQVALLYKRSLEPLLDLLHLKEHSEIIFSSDLEDLTAYKEALELVESSLPLKNLKIEDRTHYAYIRSQTAITCYMHQQRDVGVKVGWACTEPLRAWDESKFDFWFEAICQNSTLHYVYAKAGLKQRRHYKQINVREGCPYTAYARDQRYIIRIDGKQDIKTICPVRKRVAAQWKGVAEVCLNLIERGLVSPALLPPGCIKTRNARATLYNMLNHWANLQTLTF